MELPEGKLTDARRQHRGKEDHGHGDPKDPSLNSDSAISSSELTAPCLNACFRECGSLLSIDEAILIGPFLC